MTYALMIYATQEPGTISAQGVEDTLVQHRALQAETSARSELHAVARLAHSPGPGMVAMGADGSTVIADGPYIEAKEWLVGFYLIDCADDAEALERARQICTPHHAIAVRPVQWHRGP